MKHQRKHLAVEVMGDKNERGGIMHLLGIKQRKEDRVGNQLDKSQSRESGGKPRSGWIKTWKK